MKLFLHCILCSSIVTGLLSAVTTSTPSLTPNVKPTFKPSSKPSSKPSLKPRSKPTNQPTAYPTSLPSSVPTSLPTGMTTSMPTSELGGGTITSVPFSDDFSYSTIPYPTSPPIDVGKVPESGYDTFFFRLSGKLMYDASEAYSRHLCPLWLHFPTFFSGCVLFSAHGIRSKQMFSSGAHPIRWVTVSNCQLGLEICFNNCRIY